MLFSTMIITQSDLIKNTCFYKHAHNAGPRRSPDMILIAFDGKFQEKKDEIPPRACRHLKKFLKFKTMQLEMGPRPPERGVRGAAAPWEEKKGGPGPGGSAPG